MQLKSVTAGFVGALLFMAAPGQAAGPADSLDGYKADTIKAIFTEVGATDMKSEVMQGDPRLTFKIENTIFVIDFYHCEDAAAGCKMLQYACAYDPDPSDTVEAVNRYNSEFVFGKAALDQKDGLLSLRAVIWSPGASKSQVKSEFAAFLGATNALLEHMKKATIASNARVGSTFMNTSLGRIQTAAPASAKLKGLPRNRR